MYLVSDKYVKIDKCDLNLQQVKAAKTKDKQRELFFHKIIRVICDYENEKKVFIDDIYLSVDNMYIKYLLEKGEISIERETIANAILFAAYNNDVDILRQLSLVLSKNSVLPKKMGNLLDYVLEHGEDINEYFNVEEERFIYNCDSGNIEKCFIYGNNYPGKSKQLKLQ